MIDVVKFVLFLVAFPFVVYLSVKLGTFAFFKGKRSVRKGEVEWHEEKELRSVGGRQLNGESIRTKLEAV
jgi:hypothetical protein